MDTHAQGSLFHDAELHRLHWDTRPFAAFAQWLTERGPSNGFGYDPLSSEQYQAMWDKFSRYLKSHHLTLSQVRSADLSAFLHALLGRTGDGAASSTVRRYLALIDAVFEHLVGMDAQRHNPAEPLRHLPEFASGGRPTPAAVLQAMSERYLKLVQDMEILTWKSLRDQVVMLLPLACGLSTREIARLDLSDVHITGSAPSIQVRRYKRCPAHVAPIALWALPFLQTWAHARTELQFPGTVYLPATSAGQPLEDSVIYRKVSHGLSQAAQVSTDVHQAEPGSGGELAEKGPRSLRHSFALQQLLQGRAPAEVSQMLGLVTDHTVQRLMRLLPQASAQALE